jgi:hypothetical protein
MDDPKSLLSLVSGLAGYVQGMNSIAGLLVPGSTLLLLMAILFFQS